MNPFFPRNADLTQGCQGSIIEQKGGSAVNLKNKDFVMALRASPIEVLRQVSRSWTEGKLTISEVFSLYLIDMMDGPTLKDYAAAMGISQPNATYKINVLVDKGFVEKTLSAADRRETHLYTTRKARKLFKDGQKSQEDLDRMLRLKFTDEQLDMAKEVFDAVLSYLGQE